MFSRRTALLSWRTFAWLGIAVLLVLPLAVQAQEGRGDRDKLQNSRTELDRPGTRTDNQLPPAGREALLRFLDKTRREGHKRLEWYPYADNAGRHYGHRDVSEVDSPDVLHLWDKGSIDTRQDSVRRALPAELKEGNAELAPGRKAKDYFIIQLQPEFADEHSGVVRQMLRERGFEPIEYIANNGFLVRLEENRFRHNLEDTSLIKYHSPLYVADKVSPAIGFKSLLNPERARSDMFLLVVEVMPGEDTEDLMRHIDQLGGLEAREHSMSGSKRYVSLELRSNRLFQLASHPAVLRVSEQPEVVGMNLVGSMQNELGDFLDPRDFGGFLFPYRDMGITGGGIPTAGGAAHKSFKGAGPVAYDSDHANFDVPPQYLGVVDNAFSMDSPMWSHDNTNPCTGGACGDSGSDNGLSGVGPLHRKVEAYLEADDFDGSAAGDFLSCDAITSGGRSHGNTAAGVAAGAPSGVDLKNFDPNNPKPGHVPSDLGLGRRYEDSDSLDLFVTFFNDSAEIALGLDGQAPGARVIFMDAALTVTGPPGCANNFRSDVVPGAVPADRLEDMAFRRDLSLANTTLHARGAKTTLFAFGVPIFDDNITNGQGTYTGGADGIDDFLFNNRRVVHIQPVGNDGVNPADGADIDPFVGGLTATDIQINNLATGKNLVTVGSNNTDAHAAADVGFPFEPKEFISDFTSKGPATFTSLRIAPLVVAPGFDFVQAREGRFTDHMFISAAVVQSFDNGNMDTSPVAVENIVVQGNAGTSIAAGRVAGAAVQIRDYFAQGFYPTGTRDEPLDRQPDISGALVKALLANSTDFSSQSLIASCPGRFCVEEGYGSIELAAALPLKTYRRERRGPDRTTIVGPETNVPQALLVADEYFDGGLREDPNAPAADGSSTGVGVVEEGGSVSFDVFRRHGADQFRVTLAWYDAPNETLLNDLNLQVVSGDYDLATSPAGFCGSSVARNADCKFCKHSANFPAESAYFSPPGDTNPFIRITRGNVFTEGAGQFSREVSCDSVTGVIDANPLNAFDSRNAIESVMLSYLGDPTFFGQTRDGGDHGRYRIRVSYPTSASNVPVPDAPCVHFGPNGINNSGAGAVDDAVDPTWNNGAGIIRSGPNGICDTTAVVDDIQLITPGNNGQPFALVINGPVATERNNSTIALNENIYDCSGDLSLRVNDNSRCIGAGCAARQSTPASIVSARVHVDVLDPNGTLVDQEGGFTFTVDPGAPDFRVGRANHYNSNTRRTQNVKHALGRDPIPHNGIVELDDDCVVKAIYDDITPMIGGIGASPKPDVAWTTAQVQCDANMGAVLRVLGDDDDRRTLIVGGCDVGRTRATRGDLFMDAGEQVVYQVGFANNNRTTTLNLRAKLSCEDPIPGGANPCSSLTIPDPVAELDQVPPAREGIASWSILVDENVVNLPLADRAVDLVVKFESRSTDFGSLLKTQEFKFREALQADLESLYYNTDLPGGGTAAVDYNRDGLINLSGRGPGVSRRELRTYEDWFLDPNGNANPNAGLATTACGGSPCIPWHFDTSSGLFTTVRTADSKQTGAGCTVCWFYSTGGGCGWQTQHNGLAGAASGGKGTWHAGAAPTFFRDPGGGCPTYVVPNDTTTSVFTEYINDMLRSPVLNKVNAGVDALGFPFDLRMEAVGWNHTIELEDGQSNLNLEVDSNLADGGPVILGDSYSYRIPFGTDGPILGPQNSRDSFGPLRNPDEAGFPFDLVQNGNEQGVAEPMVTTGLFDANGNAVANLETDFQQRAQMPFPVADADDATAGFQNSYPVGHNVAGITCAQGQAAACFDAATGKPLIHGVCDLSNPQANNTAAEALLCTGGCGGTCTLGADADSVVVPVHSSVGNGCEVNTHCAGPGTAFGHTAAWGPDRGTEVDLVVGEYFDFRDNGDGTTFGFEFGWLVVEGGDTAMGWTLDDIYFEWSEAHPAEQDPNSTSHLNDCDDIADRPGANPGAEQCAVLALERLTFHKCSTGIKATLVDTSTSATVNTEGCTGGTVPINVRSGQEPKGETFCLEATGTPGVFQGIVKVSGLSNSQGVLFVKTAGEENFNIIAAYRDPECDQDGDGQLAENSILDTDGDGVADLGADGIGGDIDPDDFYADGATGRTDDDNCFDGLVPVLDGDPADVYNPGTPASLSANGRPQRDNSGGGTISSEDCPPALDPNGNDNQFLLSDPPGNCMGGFCSGGPKAGDACSSNFECERHGRSLATGQCDWDNDGHGDLCDNCPVVFNISQVDSDGDGVGNSCENDDSDFGRTGGITKLIPDLRQNSVDNCPTLYNPSQLCAVGLVCAQGLLCDSASDHDGDGIIETSDNCPNETTPLEFGVLPPLASETYNPTQVDSDADGIGDLCDVEDFDGDTVINVVDNCATTYNPPDPFFGIQTDKDLDGRGDDRDGIDTLTDADFPTSFETCTASNCNDYCDPDSLDDNDNAVPDDVIQIASELNCNFNEFGITNTGGTQAVVGSLLLSAAVVADDGTADGGIPDGIADPGERTSLQVAVSNASVDRQTGGGRSLANLSIGVRTTDQVVGCVLKDTEFVGSLAAGGGHSSPPTGDPDAFAFIVDPSDPGPGQSTTANLAEAKFILTAQADLMEGIQPDQEFKFIADLDVGAIPGLIPAGSCPNDPACVGVAGTLCEDFETSRNISVGYQWTRLPVGSCINPLTLNPDPLCVLGDPNDDVLGYTQDTGAIPGGTGGLQCLDDSTFAQPTCSAPVSTENDWHLHSPTEGPGVGYDTTAGIGAPDGGKSHHGTRSMHMGRHTNASTTLGDTYRFRQVSAFVLDPVPLGGASTMEFWHQIQLTDDDSFGFIDPGTTFSGTQVHVSLQKIDGDYDKWQRVPALVNGYNSSMQEAVSICSFDPGDDSLPSAGDETMCAASPLWSDIGDIIGTDATCNVDTDGNDAGGLDCGEIVPFISCFGECSGDPDELCDIDDDCKTCTITTSQFCSVNADCPKVCDTTTTTSCNVDADCPIGEMCVNEPCISLQTCVASPTGGCRGSTERSSGFTESNGTSLTGVWARSEFDLSPFAGRLARIRWIGNMGGGWSFGSSRSFLEPESGSPYQDQERDDGWWIDDIKLTDVRTGPQPIVPDAATGGSTCGAVPDSSNCGSIDITVTGAIPFDLGLGVDSCLLSSDTLGHALALDARQSVALSPPCEQGTLLYQWDVVDTTAGMAALLNPEMAIIDQISAMSPAGHVKVAPKLHTTYRVTVMCSSDPACSAVKLVKVSVAQGEGGEMASGFGAIDVDYNSNPVVPFPVNTRVFWTKFGALAPGMVGYDVHRLKRVNCGLGFTCTGVDPFALPESDRDFTFGGEDTLCIAAAPDSGCFDADVGAAAAVGSTVSSVDATNPGANEAYFYQVGPGEEVPLAKPVPGACNARTLLGMNPTGTRLNLGACCSDSGNTACDPQVAAPSLP